VNQVVQGVPKALGPKWLTSNRLHPSGLVWSGEDVGILSGLGPFKI
jgi:hypothetical protein